VDQGNGKGNGKVSRRKGQGRRDESLNRRQIDRRVGARLHEDRRVGRRRKINCPTCGFPLSQKDVCSRCQIRVIRIRKRS